jgi:hypothetical protein
LNGQAGWINVFHGFIGHWQKQPAAAASSTPGEREPIQTQVIRNNQIELISIKESRRRAAFPLWPGRCSSLAQLGKMIGGCKSDLHLRDFGCKIK